MATLTAKKTIVEMNPEEIQEHLKPMSEKLKQDALNDGAWYSYKNELCTGPDMFIHEFKNGRKELVQLGSKTGDFRVLKVF